MAARRDYAVGTDDVGRVDAADIEVSTTLHLLAEANPPFSPEVAAVVLLTLEPAQALALCESSPFYQEICDSDDFRERYNKKWHTRVHLVDSGRGIQKEYSVLRTRTVDDVKVLYEKEFGITRTDYAFFHYVPGRINTEPTAQSVLGGMLSQVEHQSWLLMFQVSALRRGDGTLTHWFANGDKIELSE